jgi:cyclase
MIAARELDLGPYADLVDAERIAGNLHRATPNSTARRGALLTGMVAYHGGQPLTCYA